MTTNDKIYYISESILKNGTRRGSRVEEGRTRQREGEKKERDKGNENTIWLYYKGLGITGCLSPILNTGFST